MRSSRCQNARAETDTTQAEGESEASGEGEPRLALTNDEDDIVHLVCCRDDNWKVAFCGEPDDSINLTASTVCTLCVEVAKSRSPMADVFAEPRVCPNDGVPCPDEHEVDLRILREVSP